MLGMHVENMRLTGAQVCRKSPDRPRIDLVGRTDRQDLDTGPSGALCEKRIRERRKDGFMATRDQALDQKQRLLFPAAPACFGVDMDCTKSHDNGACQWRAQRIISRICWMIHEKTRALLQCKGRKVVLLVLDGLGGLPHPDTGKTELDTASLPNLDRLAQSSSGGRIQIIDPGVTPGSGPAHLSLFGYHPFDVEFGRGALEALGSEFDMQPGDLAARANFATLESPGVPTSVVTDRRAGRPPDSECRRLCDKLSTALGGAIEKCEVILLPGKEHRFTVIFRRHGLVAALNDNDPQREGKALLPIVAQDDAAGATASLVNAFLQRALETLAGEETANGLLLRGFSMRPDLQPFPQRYGITAGAIAAYPMYRGVAQLVGMQVLGAPKNFAEEIALLKASWADHDFFFVHFKPTDTAGHSGLFEEKVKALETVDAVIPEIEALGPGALVVTGDHSTPCVRKEHSWHPVPTIIHSELGLPGHGAVFSERGLMNGDLGVLPATHLITLALAHAERLDKFGA